MKDISIDRIMSWGPCEDYDREKLLAITGGRLEMSWREWLALDAPIADKVWLGIRLLPEREQHLFACRCAERPLMRERKAGREPDKRSWKAPAVKRRWVDGEATDKELFAARSAARSAARAAGESDMYGAVDSAWHAAWHAALSTARAAVYAARNDWHAADAAENQTQLDDICKVLGGVD